MSSLKSKLRGKLMSSHGARRNTRNNIWIVYSLKTGGDITLASNNECIYWASQLETSPDIKSFRFGYELKARYPWEEKFRKREFVLVESKSGARELHQLISGVNENATAEVVVRDDHNNEDTLTVILFNTKDIGKLAMSATRWLQTMAFSNQIVGEICSAESDLVNLFVRSRLTGTVGMLLDHLNHQDSMKILGVFVREVLQGTIELDFGTHCFGRNTAWSMRSI